MSFLIPTVQAVFQDNILVVQFASPAKVHAVLVMTLTIVLHVFLGLLNGWALALFVSLGNSFQMECAFFATRQLVDALNVKTVPPAPNARRVFIWIVLHQLASSAILRFIIAKPVPHQLIAQNAFHPSIILMRLLSDAYQWSAETGYLRILRSVMMEMGWVKTVALIVLWNMTGLVITHLLQSVITLDH